MRSPCRQTSPPRRQARLYLPQPVQAFVPQHHQDKGYAVYIERVSEMLESLLRASEGRALVLCTAMRAVHQLAGRVRPQIPWPVLMQVDSTRRDLLQRFRAEVHAVLFATG
jgi:ATP-dependent DNA helicase DinG